MSVVLPEYYFRTRDNGAMVFRVDSENRQRRLEMDQIAVANINKGEIKAHGGYELTQDDITAIESWMEARIALLHQRTLDDIHRAVDHLNLTTQWAQSKASPEDLEEITDDLLLAMHDLRTVLVRKKADRVVGGKDD